MIAVSNPAVSRTGLSVKPTKRIGKLGGISVAHAVIDFYETLIPPLLPFFTVAFGMSFTMSGLLMWTYLTTGALLQPVVGLALDRWGIRWFIAGSLVWTGVVWGLVGFAPSYGWLLVIVALAGIGNTVFHPAASVYVKRHYPAGGGPMAIWSTSGNMGVALAPLIATLVVTQLGLSATPLLVLPGFFAAWFYLRSRRVSVRCEAGGETRRAPGSVRFMHRLKERGAPGEIGEVEPAESLISRREIGGAAIQRKSIWFLMGAVVFRSWGYLALVTFLPLMYVSLGNSETLAGIRLTAFLVVSAVSVLIGGYLSDRIGRRKVMVIALAAAAPLTVAGLIVVGPLATLLVIVGGSLLMAPHSANIVHAQELLPGRTGTAAGLVMGLGFWLASVGVLLTSVLADLHGVRYGLLLTAAIAPAIATLCALAVPETDPSPIDRGDPITTG